MISKFASAIPTTVLMALLLGGCEEPVHFENPFDPLVPLSIPTGLQLESVSETSLVLRWSDDTNGLTPEQQAAAFIIVEQSSDGTSFSALDSVVASNRSCAIARHFELNKSYLFRIYKRIGTRSTPPTNAVAGLATFSGPHGFSAGAVSEAGRDFTWSWEPVSEGAQHFRIERKEGSIGTYAVLALVPGSSRSYHDTTILRTNTDYDYRIFAVTASGTFSDPDSIRIAIPFPAPQNIGCSGADSLKLHLQWDNTFQFPCQTTVERSVDDSPYVTYLTLGAGTNGFDDSSVNKFHAYQYRLTFKTEYNASPVGQLRCSYQVTGTSNERIITSPITANSGQRATMSADGSLLVSVGDFESSVVAYPSGVPVTTVTHPKVLDMAGGVAVSRNNAVFAVIGWHSVAAFVYQIQGGKLLRAFYGNAWPGVDVALTDDGTRVILSRGSGDVQCWNIADSTLVWRTNVYNGDTYLWLLPGGREILAGNGQGVRILDVQTGEILSTSVGQAFPKTPCITRGGDILALGASSGILYNVTRGRTEYTLWPSVGSIWISSDGLHAALVSSDEHSVFFNRVAGTTVPLGRTLFGWQDYTRMLADDSKVIVYNQEGKFGVWDVNYNWSAF